jgi:hypothetical protein
VEPKRASHMRGWVKIQGSIYRKIPSHLMGRKYQLMSFGGKNIKRKRKCCREMKKGERNEERIKKR